MNASTNIDRLRSELAWLRARYDAGAISPAVHAIIRRIEPDLAWAEHNSWQSLGDVAVRVVKKLGGSR